MNTCQNKWHFKKYNLIVDQIPFMYVLTFRIINCKINVRIFFCEKKLRKLFLNFDFVSVRNKTLIKKLLEVSKCKFPMVNLEGDGKK